MPFAERIKWSAEILSDPSCHARYLGLRPRATPHRLHVPEPDRVTFRCTPFPLRGRKRALGSGSRYAIRRASRCSGSVVGSGIDHFGEVSVHKPNLPESRTPGGHPVKNESIAIRALNFRDYP